MGDTVELMRKRVLDMAIRGELVEQRPEEGTAEELILSFKKENKLKEINKDEIPYTIPQSWLWVDFESIIKSIGTKNNQIKSKEIENTGTIPVVSQGKEYIDGFSNQVDKSISPKKPVILFGDHTRNVKYIDFEFIIGADGTKIFESLLADSKYLFRWVQHASTFIENRGYSRHYSLLKKIPVPIPPLAEQKRIVEKIEEIFAVIDQISAKKEEALSIIRNMRQTALQDAIMGVLVEQDENDEPASVLYEKIQAEKEKLVKEKKIKKNKPLPEIETDKVPFEIPDKWKWVRLSDIGSIIGGGTPKTSVDAYWEGGTIPWVSPADLTGYKERTISEGRKNITELGLSKSSARLMPAGTVLFSSRAPIGYVAIAENPISTNQGFKSVVPYVMDMNHYIYYYFFAFIDDIKSRSSGTTFKEISGSELGKSFFPMPPLAEQQRIVEKLDEIMAICDQMEAIFDGTSETNNALKITE